MSLLGPYILASMLVGIGLYGALSRRNAVLMLIGVELILGGALVLLVSTAAAGQDQWSGGTILPWFVWFAPDWPVKTPPKRWPPVPPNLPQPKLSGPILNSAVNKFKLI